MIVTETPRPLPIDSNQMNDSAINYLLLFLFCMFSSNSLWWQVRARSVPSLAILFCSVRDTSKEREAYKPQSRFNAKHLWSMSVGVYCIPKDETDHQISIKRTITGGDCCGEDAYLVAQNAQFSVLAVADGVGSWRRKGIDPSKFSRSLMRHMGALVEGITLRNSQKQSMLDYVRRFVSWSDNSVSSEGPPSPHEAITPATLIGQAFWRMVTSFQRGYERPFGSSTVSLVALDRATGTLEISNLGDSGSMIIRQGKPFFRTTSQQHRFNAPYQITLSPEGTVSDSSSKATLTSLPAKEGDIVLLATDGLWDNVWTEEIMHIVNQHENNLEEMARKLVDVARTHAQDQSFESPFTVEARRSKLEYPGGKMDDITVVVAQVHAPVL